MENLTIVAHVQAAPGAADALEHEMRMLVEDTRREAGCITYELHRTTGQPDVFVFVEEWESKPLWEAHMGGEAVRAFKERIGEGKIAGSEVFELRRVA